MAHWTRNTEHAGAKNGGGFHGTRNEAKAASKVGRRAAGRRAIDEGLAEVAASDAERAEQRAAATRLADAARTVAETPEGDLYIVRSGDRYEGPSDRLMTVNRENALVAAATELLDTYDGNIVCIVVLTAQDNGDFKATYHEIYNGRMGWQLYVGDRG